MIYDEILCLHPDNDEKIIEEYEEINDDDDEKNDSNDENIENVEINDEIMNDENFNSEDFDMNTPINFNNNKDFFDSNN
jgi:hypothetical protein